MAATIQPAADTAADAAADTAAATAAVKDAFRPLVLDVAVPLVSYWAAHSVFGLGLVESLTLSSVVPAVRTLLGLVRERSLNGMATLMLVVNVAGIALAAVSSDPRLLIAKDGVLSSAFGLAVLCSAFGRQPLMTAGLRPMVVRGNADRAAAWDRLLGGSAEFRHQERNFSLVWGIALVTECVAKVIGAYTLPVATMAWLGTVILLAAIAVAILAANPFAERITRLVEDEAAAAEAR